MISLPRKHNKTPQKFANVVWSPTSTAHSRSSRREPSCNGSQQSDTDSLMSIEGSRGLGSKGSRRTRGVQPMSARSRSGKTGIDDDGKSTGYQKSAFAYKKGEKRPAKQHKLVVDLKSRLALKGLRRTNT